MVGNSPPWQGFSTRAPQAHGTGLCQLDGRVMLVHFKSCILITTLQISRVQFKKFYSRLCTGSWGLIIVSSPCYVEGVKGMGSHGTGRKMEDETCIRIEKPKGEWEF